MRGNGSRPAVRVGYVDWAALTLGTLVSLRRSKSKMSKTRENIVPTRAARGIASIAPEQVVTKSAMAAARESPESLVLPPDCTLTRD